MASPQSLIETRVHIELPPDEIVSGAFWGDQVLANLVDEQLVPVLEPYEAKREQPVAVGTRPEGF